MPSPPRRWLAGRLPSTERLMYIKDAGQLYRARRFKGWSQTQVAALCSCTQATISLIETGKMTRISERLAMDLARELGFTDYLNVFSVEDPMRDAEATPVRTSGEVA